MLTEIGGGTSNASRRKMSGGKPDAQSYEAKDDFVRVRKRDLDKLTTEVMQLREFLPRVLNRGLVEKLHKARTAQTMKEQLVKEQEQLRQELLHLQSRLEAAQAECQKEREEKLLLRDQLWQSGTELQQQADFCSALGSATCSLLWSCSASEDTITQWLADGKLKSFLAVAAQTLESFVGSLDAEVKTEDHDSQEHQFVLALAGTITNIAALPGGRNFLSSSVHILMDTLMKLLEQMKPGVFPKLKVLMLMALYNVSISVSGLRYISENPRLITLIWSLLNDGDWEVCLHSLRLLQSVLLEEEAPLLLGSSLLDPELLARLSHLTSSTKPSLREAAQQTLEDLHALQQGQGCKQNSL
ncbi:heat shock factor 2-binding protein isoform X2 [Platichthys flesus]|uniref:heat shock factor 2-binding protein isoform X2 n=1 Tax=Platichthys flesus TaxID=8260 RepID=UPI002DBFB0AE|nr:heat shock factor 2-binding protein isoform X2 [Platichthys flesus]